MPTASFVTFQLRQCASSVGVNGLHTSSFTVPKMGWKLCCFAGAPICSFPPEGDTSLQLEWRADKLLMAMRGPLLVLGKLHVVSADFSRAKIAYGMVEQRESKQGSGDELGRFWERPSEDVEDDVDEA